MTDHSENTVDATVIIPTIAGRGPLLPYSIGSVLAQSITQIEVFVIGDGVDDEARQIIEELQAKDARIRFFDHGKHAGRGEPNRHTALAEAHGRIVCYLCDRDLMLPNHIETMLALLVEADFAHTLISAISPKGQPMFRTALHLADIEDRKWILEQACAENGIPLSFAGHTMEMYRKLPHGWRTTPPGKGTDVYMWEQFIAQPECRAISSSVPTVLYFPRYWRSEWTTDQKLHELKAWRQRMDAPDWSKQFAQFVIKGLADEHVRYGRRLRHIGVRLSSLVETFNQINRSR